MASLDRAIERMQALGRPFLADPVLDPIHFGFTESLVRYHALRQRHPGIELMMGVGNLTELTHADTAGINALLLGICSEQGIRHILATEVSRHARNTVGEANLARRILYAARQIGALPRYFDEGLMALHERAPYPLGRDDIEQLHRGVRDPSYRIQVSPDGIHVFNRDGFHTVTDPFDAYPALKVEHDAGHAFYLGVELARAQIAWQLGKRYTQDEPLNWGCQVERTAAGADPHTYKPAGTTLTSVAQTGRSTAPLPPETTSHNAVTTDADGQGDRIPDPD
jgi:dihydropteroate synthase-like protein